MKLHLCILFLVISVALFGNWDWAMSVGGASSERVWDIAADGESNIFVAGDFNDSLYVDGQSYPGFGLMDSYVMKYSPAGNLLWAKTFGSTGEDVALSVDTDLQGNCYITGYFVESITIQDQGIQSNGGWDVYVLKLSPQGDLLWLRSFGGEMYDIGYGLAVSPIGRVYITGWFSSTISLPNSDSITSAGGSDVYCVAMDTDGSFSWARRGGREAVEYGYELACDDAGNVYVTGVAGSGSQFGSYTLPTNGMYVCKYSPEGDELWLASGAGGAVVDIAVQAGTGNNQYGMVCGRLNGSGNYGSFPFSSIGGGDDAYWAQFDAATGEWLSLNGYGGEAADKGKDVDCTDYPVFLASFEGTASFGNNSFTSNGDSDFVLGYGNAMQFVAAGGEGSEVPTSIKILPNGKIALAGWHLGLGQIGSYTIDSGNAANLNAFIACYSPQGSSTEDNILQANSIMCSPNPFTNYLQISIDKTAHSNAQLQVYNLKGQLIRSLKPEAIANSSLQYRWNGQDTQGKNCSAGVYLLKMGSSTRKAIKL